MSDQKIVSINKIEDKLKVAFSKANLRPFIINYENLPKNTLKYRLALISKLTLILLKSPGMNKSTIVIVNRKVSQIETIILKRLEKIQKFTIVIENINSKKSVSKIFENGFIGGSTTCKNISQLSIGGGHIRLNKNYKLKKILAIMTVYNEEDIIKNTVTYLLNQGLHVHIVDNWSTDNTLNIASNIAKNNNKVSISRWPNSKKDKNSSEFSLKAVLENEMKVIDSSSTFDWFIHHDADEIRESPWPNLTLQQAISHVDSFGYNALDFTLINFRPITNSYTPDENLEDFFHFFEYPETPGSQIQIKCWKKQINTKVDLVSSLGHQIQFEERKVFPLKFLLKHYPLRSFDHAEKKILLERIPRFNKEERRGGAHFHYDKIAEEKKFIYKIESLHEFNKNFYTESLFERLFGILIKL